MYQLGVSPTFKYRSGENSDESGKQKGKLTGIGEGANCAVHVVIFQAYSLCDRPHAMDSRGASLEATRGCSIHPSPVRYEYAAAVS